jgi:ABC-type sugar transport system ATPase subunit
VILISHILPEVLDNATRIVVMKDGRVVADRPGREFTQEGLVAAMGSAATAAARRETRAEATGAPVVFIAPPRGLPVRAGRGRSWGSPALRGMGRRSCCGACTDACPRAGGRPPRRRWRSWRATGSSTGSSRSGRSGGT